MWAGSDLVSPGLLFASFNYFYLLYLESVRTFVKYYIMVIMLYNRRLTELHVHYVCAVQSEVRVKYVTGIYVLYRSKNCVYHEECYGYRCLNDVSDCL